MTEDENKEKIPEENVVSFKIPTCCLEGWDSCPHIAKKVKPKKQNVGL
jgi:hypothetical protein